MKSLLLLLVLLPDILADDGGDHAQFSWTDCGDNVADQCMMVVFPSDNTVDMALLNYVDGEITVLSGHLKEDEGISVAVTVEEHQLEITMHSPHDDNHSMYIVNLESGATEIVEIPDDVIFDKPMDVPGGFNASKMDDDIRRNIERRSIPTNGYNLRTAIFYDDNFSSFAGGQAGAQTKLTSIFNHVKTLYTQFSAQGREAIKPSLHSINYRSGRWTAGGSLRTVSWISNGLQWDVDMHVYVTYRGSQSGIVGMAWVGSTCSIYQFYRSNINEWFHTDTIAAQIIAHEMGHNLGMYHDFNGRPGSNRYYNGQLCTNIGGYMDYTRTPTRWSPCSVGDFNRYHSWVGSNGGNDGVRPARPFCLKESDQVSAPGTSCKDKCVAAWTEAAPSCISKDTACTNACTAGTCT